MDPPDLQYLGDGTELDESGREALRYQMLLLEIQNQQRNRRARNMGGRKVDDVSDSEDDTLATNLKGKMKLTPTDSTPQELVKLDPAEIGMSVGYKHLYSGKEDKRGRFQWQTEIPEDLGKPAEDAESEKWAIIVRHVKVYNDPTKVLSLHSILIQSPLLKDLLKEVLAGYPGVTVGLKRLEFSGRFEPLIHRWTQFNAAIAQLKVDQEPESAEKLKHAELLHDLLAKEFKDTIEQSADMRSQGVMTYEHMWTIFQPGSHVYSKQDGQERIFRLYSCKYGHNSHGHPVFWLTCQYVDYDGTRFGTNKFNMCIPIFEGTRPITNLPTLPLEFHNARDELKAKLVERGSKVEAYSGSHYRAYHGVGWRTGAMGAKDKFTIKGRIVIDTQGWNRFNPNMSIFVTPLHVKDNTSANGVGGGDQGDGDEAGGDEDYDDGYNPDDDDGGMPMDGYFADEEEEGSKRMSLTEEQKLICTPLVRGYALKEKLWLNFFVNAVQEVTFSSRAFDSLVLPKNQKELILGFTETQQSYRSQFDDVIEGKGRGIILLLCGPPGVGKTLTAESVAEEMKVPLYMMSAGDLGLEPRHVESKLQGILDMCTRWNAILLIDEADVFLESRSLHELERNKLVSIFLRVLEYYAGIMFLTTNRVQTFDPAFQSRIHISLEYAELDAKSRKMVWKNFLDQHDVAQAASRDRPVKALVSAAKATNAQDGTAVVDTAVADEEAKELHRKRTLPHTMSAKDIDKLSGLSMNGRQIKNILKTAQLLASKRGQGLSYEHVSVIMEVTQHLHNTSQEGERVRNSVFS